MRLEVHPFKTDSEARIWGEKEIDASAGKARARYLTIAEGQEATYTAKYADAKAYLEAGPEPDMTKFPWIKREADRTGVTYDQAALVIKTQGDLWNFEIGPDIEAARMDGKKQMNSVIGVSQIVAAVRAAQRELDQI